MIIRIALISSILGILACGQEEIQQTKLERSTIKGIWWSPQMFQSAAFEIKDSTIYYPDYFREYRYDLSGDTILVYQDEGFILKSVVLRATKDTLVLVTQGIKEIYTHTETPMP